MNFNTLCIERTFDTLYGISDKGFIFSPFFQLSFLRLMLSCFLDNFIS